MTDFGKLIKDDIRQALQQHTVSPSVSPASATPTPVLDPISLEIAAGRARRAEKRRGFDGQASALGIIKPQVSDVQVEVGSTPRTPVHGADGQRLSPLVASKQHL